MWFVADEPLGGLAPLGGLVTVRWCVSLQSLGAAWYPSYAQLASANFAALVFHSKRLLDFSESNFFGKSECFKLNRI